MGKLLQSDKMFILPHPASTLSKKDTPPDTPPQIPPRMKKKGPALPEKPPHIRAKSNNSLVSTSSQLTATLAREPLKPRILNLDMPQREVLGGGNGQREVLVAASKSGRERPVEKRQREPAKLLMPTKKDLVIMPSIHLDDSASKKMDSVSKALLRLDEILPSKKDLSVSRNPLWSSLDDHKNSKLEQKSSVVRKSRPLQPVLLIPRNLLTWGSSSTSVTPISYALWTPQRDAGRGLVVKPSSIRQGLGNPLQVRHNNNNASIGKSETTSGTSAVRLRSNSVTRSGSLTSQGSSSSDSGGETFPKSVLKKQRRANCNSHSSKGGTHGSNRRVDQKKNVTFNAFATVQLMEE